MERSHPSWKESRVNAPLPLTKCNMPDSETDHKTEPKVDVATQDSESIVRIDTESPKFTSVKFPRIYSPAPYSRYSTPYSQVNWHKLVESSVPEEKQIHDHQINDILMLEKKPQNLPEIPSSNENSARSSPVAQMKDVHANALIVALNKTTSVDRTSEKKDDFIVTETSQGRCNSDKYFRAENDIKQTEDRCDEQLIKVKQTEKEECATKRDTMAKETSKTTKMAAKQTKLRKRTKVFDPKTTTDKESIKYEDIKEIQELKRVYEAHLKEKEKLERLIEKRENELKEQLREMDEVMESIYSENNELEKATGAFADAVKVHNNYKNEVARVRVQHIEQEISSDILFEENVELKEEIRGLYDQINAIKERRAIGLNGLEQDTEEMKYVAEQLKSKNEEVEAETKKKMEEFNSLRMIMTDKCITSDKKGDIVKELDGAAAFPRPSISKSSPLVSLKMISFEFKINITDTDNVSPEIGAPRNHNSTDSGRLSKCVSEKNLSAFTETDTVKRNEHGKRLISGGSQKRDHSTDGEVGVLKTTKNNGEKTREGDVPVCEAEDKGLTTVRIIPEVTVSHGVHEKKSRIPKPLVQPYKSATKESDRYKASEGSILIMEQRENSQNKSEELKDSKVCLTGDMLNKYSVKKNETAAKRCKKKEIQSKIDTGLKTRPSNVEANKSRRIVDDVSKIGKTVTRKVTVKEYAPMQYNNRTQKLQSSRQIDNKRVSLERA